jgi:hypothetical protein
MAELGYRFLGAFGAILTILTLAFHTLIQNAISTRSGKLEIDGFYGDPIYGASYPQGNNYTTMYNKYPTSETLGDQGPTLDMVADITYGMYYTMMYNDTQTQLSIANCLYGNCTVHGAIFKLWACALNVPTLPLRYIATTTTASTISTEILW